MIDFHLPGHLIAQFPAERRDHSRLLVVNRAESSLAHYHFAELPELLKSGDLLILNDTRVLSARLYGCRERTGGKWEGLFLRQTEDGTWVMLCQTRGKLVAGESILVDPGPLRLRLIEKLERGTWRFQPSEHGDAADILLKFGHMPLPPYIRKGTANENDRDRYQTVYAQQPGAVAAPTAGLHFTDELFTRLRQENIGWAFLTLHVGWGTFQPIQCDDYARHRMHSEWARLTEETVNAINACQRRGGRVVAVGTTTVRVLESAAAGGELRPWSGETNLFIHPPFEFRAVDALITNFHLPQTTLLLLVSAFAGDQLLQKAYHEAIAKEYRFYSYGDAMLIV